MIQYDNSSVRRQDRLLPEERALQLLREGEYGYLSMALENGKAYGIPLNYVWTGEVVYFHCAPEGIKLKAMEKNPAVSFCVVGHTHVLSAKFTTAYESIVVDGRMELVADDEERMKALEAIIDKYSPEHKVVGLKYAKGSFHRTYLLRLTPERMTGKCKQKL